MNPEDLKRLEEKIDSIRNKVSDNLSFADLCIYFMFLSWLFNGCSFH